MDKQELEKFAAQLQADTERFNRRQVRTARIALWFLPFYAIGMFCAVQGMGFVAERLPEMRGTLALLVIGFVLIVVCQWAQPYWTRRANRKDETGTGTGVIVQALAPDERKPE